MNNINQYADQIFNANLIYMDGKIHKINKQSNWYFDLGKSSGRFSYKNELISLIGRDAEIQWLYDFMHHKKNFFVSAITGRAGNGKSSLVYSFFKNKVNKDEWHVLGVSYECLDDTLIAEIIENTHVLLVIDYVLVNAEKIGEWIKKLLHYER